MQNGEVFNVQRTYRAGETLHFDCHSGYAAEDSDEARCQPGGIWDPPVLVCHRGEWGCCSGTGVQAETGGADKNGGAGRNRGCREE